MDENLLKKALDAAYRHLARSPRSCNELERKLREKNHPEPIIRQVIQRLEEYRYLDDRAFALQWARDRFSHRHWGPSRLRIELQRKGIAEEWIEEALRELFVNKDEVALVMDLVARRLKGRGLHDPREHRRTFAYLLRRGYSPDAIGTALRRLKKDTDFPAP
ncbi:MAG: regulatory protein RecX [Nitrospirae bacterium]|nr:regulatory protein RecX [Nitrospirota bacterium]